jgi:hypothetical protein
MIIEVTMQIEVHTTETEFTDELKAEINKAIATAFRPAYEKGSFVQNFNRSNGPRYINHYEINCSKRKT